MRPGDVAPCGRIKMRDGKLLAAGSVYVRLSQALEAHRYGWRITSASCNSKGRMLFTIQRKAVTTTG